jgi:RNA polymerase sigma-B factor
MSFREEIVARYCAERTIERRNAVVEAHRHLCLRGAKKFKRASNEQSDLEQIAAIGLIKAAEYYRTEMQTPFEAYAWIMIVGELMHYVRDHERIVRIPRQLRTLEKRFLSYWERYAAEHHREPSIVEVASALGVRAHVVEELRALRRAEHVTLSDPGDADSFDRIEMLAESGRCVSIEERIALALALEELGDRERTIVLGTYGADLTQSELGERLGLSQSHVSKLLARAIGKIGRRVA